MEAETILRVENQTKVFGPVIANDCITFDIRRGEVHCLLGENGAGKSTLAKCLYGAYRPDSGTIYIKGNPTHFSSPGDAIKAGIGMVHQHFVLAHPLTVLENIVVGTESRLKKQDLRDAREKVRALCETYHIDIDLDLSVYSLSTGKQQWVEILKALYVGIEILILDEPTAVLTPQESERLFAILQKMTREGLSIVLITHKLQEVMNISNRVTVLRKGKVVGTCDTRDMTKHDLALMMIGRDITFQMDKPDFYDQDAILELRHLSLDRHNGQNLLCDLNLQIHRHEILGLAGVAGNGQQDLFDLLVGVKKPSRGSIYLDGKDITNLSSRQRMSGGVASIPPDRMEQGLLLDFSVQENMILGFQWSARFRSGVFLSAQKISSFAEESIHKYNISTPSVKHRAGLLSGGNLQKVIIAREFSQRNKFLVASSPTRGLDIGATEFVHQRIMELRNEGAGILLISEDLDEIFSLSDRIAVINKGVIMGIVDGKAASVHKIGLWMAGIREGEE